MSDVKGRVLLGVNAFNDDEEVYFYVRNGGSVLCVASPRYGKGALCKNLAVQVSKFKKVCVFDYRGEWVNHVTNENPESRYPDALSDFFVADNFAFPITEFGNFGDWVGFGFEDDAATFMLKIVRSDWHGGGIEKIRLMIQALPVKDDDVHVFNEEYGTDLLVPIHFLSKGALGRRFEVVQRFFHTGQGDSRKIIDFGKVWREYEHLIIDLSDRKDGFKDIGKARAYAGLILRKFRGTDAFFFFEEASQLLANPQRLPDGSRVGLSELHNSVYRMVTLEPKHGVNVLIMAQSRNQVYDAVVDYLPIEFIGRLNKNDALTPQEKELNELIWLEPSTLRREWFVVDNFFLKRVKFVAAVPRCLYETNV